jgi:flagella basal body P-ring formation protein FlgA
MLMNRRLLSITILPIIVLMNLFSCSSIWANTYESQENIKAIVTQFIQNNLTLASNETINVQLVQANHTMQVPTCNNSLEASLPIDQNREHITSVKLSCNDTNAWQIYVPVDVQVYTKVLVAKRPLSANELITEDDLDYANADKNHLYMGYFNNKNDVIGLEPTQTIMAGTVLSKSNLQKPVLVHRNDSIDLIAGNTAVFVTMKGVSKTDGRLNDKIIAFNPISNKSLDAIVTGPGKAKIIS